MSTPSVHAQGPAHPAHAAGGALPPGVQGGRRGSYRGSRLSSIGHSYSGSVDMTEASSGAAGTASPQLTVLTRDHRGDLPAGSVPGVRRNRSFELQVGSLLFCN